MRIHGLQKDEAVTVGSLAVGSVFFLKGEYFMRTEDIEYCVCLTGARSGEFFDFLDEPARPVGAELVIV